MQIQKYKKIYSDMSSYNLVPLPWTCVMLFLLKHSFMCVFKETLYTDAHGYTQIL